MNTSNDDVASYLTKNTRQNCLVILILYVIKYSFKKGQDMLSCDMWIPCEMHETIKFSLIMNSGIYWTGERKKNNNEFFNQISIPTDMPGVNAVPSTF